MMRKPKVKIHNAFRTRRIRFNEVIEISKIKYASISVKRSYLICFMEKMSDEKD